MKVIVLSTSGLSFTEERRSGNTTRIINNAIKLLFSNKGNPMEVICVDHFKSGQWKAANKHIFERIIQRIEREHNLRHKIGTGEFILDEENFTITRYKI